VLQFLKSGIMEIPDVLVVTKADLGRPAMRALADLRSALRSLGARQIPVIAVSSVPPPTGIGELVDALDAHRAGLDLSTHRLHARRLHALADFSAEHGERGLRALGGRRAAERWLEQQDPGLDVATLARSLAARASTSS
jgi:LAO/AO transport system kinase